MDIESNFRSDLMEMCKSLLAQAKFKFTVDPDRDYWILFQFCDVELKRVTAKPRAVITHPEFTCPEGEQEGLKLFLEKVQRGEDLSRHANVRIMIANKPDELLADWRIHHFHLGTVQKPDGFMERTDNVLFAFVTLDALYALAVWPHVDDQGEKAWTRQECLQIVHKHWPELLESKRLVGVLGGEGKPPTGEEIDALRQAGINYIPTMPDGASFVPIGGGVSRSKARQADPDTARKVLVSHAAVRRGQAYLHAVREAEKFLRANADQLPELAAKNGFTLPAKPTFKLEMDEGWFYGTEPVTGFSIRLQPPRPARPW